MTNLFRGVATALATTMMEDGSIDFDSYERLVNFQLENSINALIVSGTTGEGSTLTMDEKIELLKLALRARGDQYDCPIILGTGSNNTSATIENTRLAKENGADAALIVTPYYNKTSQRGLIAHYFAIADAVDIPIILYNVPGRTGMTIQPETVVELAKHPNIIALKDATGDMTYLETLRGLLGENSDFSIYSGDDPTFFDFLIHGGDGIISVVTNCLPEAFVREYKLFLDGDIVGARNLQSEINPFIKSLFSDVSPTPVKAVLKEMGIGDEFFRLPLIATTEEVRSNVIKLYNQAKNI
ncbi:4-hydroxy-tetrahydrodipicolinate synthase [Peptostreptococcus russellii]|uniref:4-hydroxy-tetrahydrodipicolinate synthase n=1 Tax=Peptostreptococcus russellii TaxID=215200 RepID=UPI003F5896C6